MKTVRAQVLDATESLHITTSKGVTVKLYKKANSFDKTTNDYYCLPVKLKFSTLKDGLPEFSLLTYKTGGKVGGSVLHFLAKWGLTPQENKEIDNALKKQKGNTARFVGAVIPEPDNENPKLCIKGSSPLVSILNQSATNIGKTPLFPNTKLACSFKLDQDNTETLNAAIKNKSAHLKTTIFALSFVIKYRTKQSRLQKSTFELKANLYKLLNN